MFRSAVKRLLVLPAHRRFGISPIITNSSRFSTDSNAQPISEQKPNHPHQQPESLGYATASSSAEEAARRDERQRPREGERRQRIDYQDEQVPVLQAALRHVVRLGWTEEAMIAGAREVGVSPSVVGSFPRKEAALIEFFMDDCLQRLIDRIDLGDELRNLIPSERVSKLIRIRLEMQAPYISKWPQALRIQAQPMNIPTSFKQRAMLVDEIWHATGVEVSDIDWYLKRTVLGGIYSTSEVYMLTDNSPDFCDTWTFLDRQVKEVFDLEKTIQEVKYLAEAVGAGMGNSLQGFMRRVFR